MVGRIFCDFCDIEITYKENMYNYEANVYLSTKSSGTNLKLYIKTVCDPEIALHPDICKSCLVKALAEIRV